MKKKLNLKLSALFILFVSTLTFAQTAEEYAKNGLNNAMEGKKQEAIADYTRSLELKQSTDTYFKRAIVYMQAKEYVKSIEDFNKAETAKKTDSEFYCQRGKCKSLMKDNEGAIADFTKSISLKPDYGMVYFNRGLSKITLKDKEGACADLQKALDLKYDKALETFRVNCQ